MIELKVDNKKMEEIENKHLKWCYEIVEIKRKEYLRTLEYKDKEGVYKDISNENIKLLKYIQNEDILKAILIGKVNIANGEISIINVTENILKEFPEIFSSQIEKSTKRFLKTKRKQMDTLEEEDRNDSERLNLIKNSIKNYFSVNKDILEEYIEDIDTIGEKINKIYLTKKQIRNFNVDNFIEYTYNDRDIFEETEIILSDIFNYDKFIRTENEWNAYKLLEMMNVTVCPYCNRQYINTFISENGRSRAHIDHFYPKSKYPFLGISLYNFIPSCYICNASFKGDIDTFLIPHLNPNQECFGELVKFKTRFCEKEDIDGAKKITDINYLIGESSNFEIKLEVDSCKIDNEEFKNKVQNSINTFNLERIYDFHKDYVREIIKKSFVYNDSRISELYNNYGDIFNSEKEIIQMIFSNYITSEDLGKRPLSKLTKDIIEELKLF